jgi:hypothetical protein
MGDKSRDKIVGGKGVDSVKLLLKLSYERLSSKSFQLYELSAVI